MAAPARPPLPTAWTSRRRSSFVGRQRERAELDDAWSRVTGGSRQVVVVGGEPGAGKSRLLAETCPALHAAGARVLVGTCVPDLGLPYQPFVEPVEALLGQAQDAGVRERLRVVAGRSASRPGSDEPEHRRELYDAVVQAFSLLCQDVPLVLALEDLHWAGPPALELLTYLVEHTAGLRLLVVATHRTTAPDRSAALLTAVSRLHRLDGVRRLDLDALQTQDIADYLVREAGVPAGRADGPAAVLRDETGGNPFFLRELWRDLQARGGLAALGTGEGASPLSVRDALRARLLSLQEPHLQTLELAAVVGEEVDVPLLVAASAWSRDTTLLALDEGVAYGLLEEAGPGRYRFVHALARQAVYDRLAPSRRARQHAQVAQALESRPDGSVGQVQALAHHYTQAQHLGYGAKAVGYLVEAGCAAERALAHEDAARCFEQASALSDDPGRRDDLALMATRSHLLGGDFARARTLAEQVAASPDATQRLRASVLYEAASWRPGLPGQRAVALLSSALDGGTQDDDDPLRIRALASLGRALAFLGDTEAAGSVGAAAVGRARRLGDDALLAHALQASLWHGLRPQDVPAKLARATELSELAHRTGDLGHLGPAAYYRGVISYVLGDPQGWSSATDDLTQMSRATGQGFFTYMAGCLEYGQQFVSGRFATAGRTCTALLDLGDSFGTDDTEGSSAVQTFMLRRETGAVERVRGLVSGREDPTAHWAPGLLALYTALALDEPAARVLRWLLTDELVQHRDSAHWPAVLAFAVEAALHLEDHAAAEQLRPELEPYRGLNLVAGQFVALFGSADRYLGALDSLLGRPGADEELASALALDRATGAPVHEAHTLAAMVVDRRRVGADVDELVRRTRELAEPLGLVIPLDVVTGRRTRVPVQPREGGLTHRETEVLRLVGQGLPNREIGQRLCISEHTAANHIRSILAKTGSTNRTQAARYAADHDLLR